MLNKTKAKEMRRRTSQRRATHRARRAALTLRAETRMAAEMRRAAEAEKSKTEARIQRPRQIDRESKQAQEEIIPRSDGLVDGVITIPPRYPVRRRGGASTGSSRSTGFARRFARPSTTLS